MPESKRIAGLVGPTIVAMIASEFPLVQPHPQPLYSFAAGYTHLFSPTDLTNGRHLDK